MKLVYIAGPYRGATAAREATAEVGSGDLMNERTCFHFNGIQHDRCDALVWYADVQQKGGYRLPCLPPGSESLTCEKRRYPTAEEIAADRAETKRILAAIFAGRSPCCDAPLDESQVRKGVGVRYCSKCKAFVYRGCRG